MTNCEECVYYEYDPETDANYCEADLDEDDMERFLRSANDAWSLLPPRRRIPHGAAAVSARKAGSPRLFFGGASVRHEKGTGCILYSKASDRLAEAARLGEDFT